MTHTVEDTYDLLVDLSKMADDVWVLAQQGGEQFVLCPKHSADKRYHDIVPFVPGKSCAYWGITPSACCDVCIEHVPLFAKFGTVNYAMAYIIDDSNKMIFCIKCRIFFKTDATSGSNGYTFESSGASYIIPLCPECETIDERLKEILEKDSRILALASLVLVRTDVRIVMTGESE